MSNDIQSGGLITYSVKVNGSTIPGETMILSIEIDAEVNRIPKAVITVLDGEPALGDFPLSNSSTFVPGNEISIEAGYDNKNNLIFSGIITRQSLVMNNNIGSVLKVECRDKAIRMTVGRKNNVFQKKKDSEVISTIISNYPGLSQEVTETSETHPELTQYYATDWDFIQARAEVNGLITMVQNGKVTIRRPDQENSSAMTITYGTDIYEFHADLDSVTQLGSVQAGSWDYETQQVQNGSASNTIAGPGNISSHKLSEVIGLKDFQLQTPTPLESKELTTWAKAQMIKSEFAKIRGEVKIQGTNFVVPGKYITLKGVGERFNGNHLVSGTHHSIADGNWYTEATFGLSPVWFTEEPDVMAPPASGLLPGISGLFPGTVKQIHADPDSQYRVLVDIPLLDPTGNGIWARLANFYATNGAGAFFMPEIGDEVILGFLNEDPRFPVILGSVYSSSNHKPFAGLSPNEQNSLKAIVSKTGISLQFDDEHKVLTLTTPGKNQVILSDLEKTIWVKDQNDNSCMLSESGISLKSPKNISLQADQKVSIQGKMGVEIEATGGDVRTRAINIKENADMQFEATGAMTATVQGGAELTLKGAMVMIN